MLPTGKTPIKQDLNSLTVLTYGPSKIGKCLAGDTELINPLNARPTTIREMVSGHEGSVFTMMEGGHFAAQEPSAFLENEPAQLYRLTTQTGRSIEATANHPFLTREGWKPLEQLTVNDRVAVVAEYDHLHGDSKTDPALIKILAYLIADGSLAGGSSPVFTKSDSEVRFDFESAVEAKGDECIEFENDQGLTHVRIRGKQGSRNNVIAYLREIGLDGLKSAEKFIPDFVYGLRPGKLSLFLNRLFTCDGSMEMSGRISYSSTSLRLVRQVQHLLLRFGIVSLVRDRYLDGNLYGAELLIASKSDVLKFIDEIGFYGEKAAKAEIARAALYNIRGVPTQLDRTGSILFDRITSIEPTRIESVYDLTIDGTHNFIANDFIVHNSTFCAQADHALFLATEPGLNSLEVFQTPVNSWEDLLAACAEIAEGKHPFKTIVIDTLDNAYRMCSDYICKKFKIEHESDLGFGKGYALINNEFLRVLNKLAFLPYGLFLISHSQEKEIETRTGKLTRIVPTLPDKARKQVLGMVDLILFCDIEVVPGEDGKPSYKRVMRTKPSPNYEAGDRTGRMPEVLDLDFKKFLEAFNTPVAGAKTNTSRPESRPATPAKPTTPANQTK